MILKAIVGSELAGQRLDDVEKALFPPFSKTGNPSDRAAQEEACAIHRAW